MLRWRLLAALLILTPLLVLLYLDGYSGVGLRGIWLIPVGWLVALAATGETLALCTLETRRPASWSVYVGVSLLFLSACDSLWQWLEPVGFPASVDLMLVAPFGAMTLLFLVEMVRYKEPGQSRARLAVGALALLYPGVPMMILAQLRFIGSAQQGFVALISMILVVKMADVGAYAAGKLWGRHAMSPRLSPAKTWEGFAGALVAASLSSWVYFQWIAPVMIGSPTLDGSHLSSLIYGVALALAGMLGDLAESLLKRDRSQKDSSHWLPGLGGVLDVLDSVLFAAPLAYLFWASGLME